MQNFIINVLFIALAIVAIILTAIAMYKVRQLKIKYKAAIILIPLYYKRGWHFALLGIFIALIATSVVLLFLTEMFIVFCSIIVILVFFSALIIKMITCRFAVLDCGIIVPFRYIDWLHLYEFKIKAKEVFFYKDGEGYDTIRAISPRLSFDEANISKLEFLLNRNKVKNK